MLDLDGVVNLNNSPCTFILNFCLYPIYIAVKPVLQQHGILSDVLYSSCRIIMSIDYITSLWIRAYMGATWNN